MERLPSLLIEDTISNIQHVYLMDQRPWVLGYSGGKDSTALAQLVFRAVKGLPPNKRHKHIYILSSDTLVETPLIVDYIKQNLSAMQTQAETDDLPITTVQVTPTWDHSFWVSMIGRGYPSPRQKFRWCTDRLKIEPANRFILNTVSQYGEVIVLLGVRKSESAVRAQVLSQHSVEGKILQKHSVLPNAYVFAPIQDFVLDDVWTYLLQYPSPWGSDNNDLLALYQDSQSGECPLVIDKGSPSCGNSRFGCWVCTVVKEDKALIGFIDNGHEELIPLLDFRNWLQEIREQSNMREKKRVNGQVYYINTNEGKRLGLGPFTLEARKLILRKLLETEKMFGKQLLIQDPELAVIRRLWQEQGDWEDSLPGIVREVRGQVFGQRYSERPLLSSEQLGQLDTLCEENNIKPELLRKLINLELEHYGYKHRHSLFKNMDRLLKQDWVHIYLGEDLGS